MFIVLFLYLLMASTFTLAKAAVMIMPPVFFIATRMVVAGILLLSYLYFFKPTALRYSSAHLRLFAHIAIFHIYLAYILEFIGLQTVSSSKASLLYNLSPFITALIVYYLYGQKLSMRKWIGLIIGVIGMLPIMMTPEKISSLNYGFWKFGTADILVLAGVSCAAYGWIVMKELVVLRRYSPLFVNGVGMLAGGLLASVTSLFTDGFPPVISVIYDQPVIFAGIEFSPWAASLAMGCVYMMLLILIANILGYNLYGYLMHYYSATFLSFAGLVTPLFAGLLGWLFLNEKIATSFFITFLITVVGLYIFYQDELSQRDLIKHN